MITAIKNKIFPPKVDMVQENLYTIYKRSVGTKVPSYTAPSDETKTNVANFVTAIYNQSKMITKYMKILNITRYNYDTLYGPIQLYKPTDRTSLMSVTIIYRAKSKSNFCIESPHEGKDGPLNLTIDLIRNANWKFFLSNYVHPLSIPPVGTQHSLSDMCHNMNNLLTTCQMTINNLNPNSLFLQVHGMRDAPQIHMLVVNIFNSQFTTIVRSGCTLLAYALREKFSEEDQKTFVFGSTLPFDNVYISRSGVHTSTVQGIVLNRKSDSGKFIHFETDSKFIGLNDIATSNRAKLILAFDEMMKNWDNNVILSKEEPRRLLIGKDSDFDSDVED